MVVVLTPRDQEFLERGNSTIVAMDQSKVKNKTIEDDSSKQYKASKQRQGHRWAVWCADNGHPISPENKEHITKHHIATTNFESASPGEKSGYTLQEWLEEMYFDGERNDDLTQEDILKEGKLVRSMLQFEPSKRASVKEMLQDSWFKGE
ncbi:hypothetical protein F5882DRAFT_477151 [Hyaloscypha sp. PMI_1271]|nr:hypothetical protein F5882DRAFT_477151 [Hyaloscypha sp. PMI_1271]